MDRIECTMYGWTRHIIIIYIYIEEHSCHFEAQEHTDFDDIRMYIHIYIYACIFTYYEMNDKICLEYLGIMRFLNGRANFHSFIFEAAFLMQARSVQD